LYRTNVPVAKLLVFVLLLLGGTVAHVGSGVFSVSFYANNTQEAECDDVMVDADQSAGFEDWETNDCENIMVPWNPGADYESQWHIPAKAVCDDKNALHFQAPIGNIKQVAFDSESHRV